MKIYTCTGDDGETSLFSGERVSKAALRVEAYGGLDELNSVLGVARAAGPHERTIEYLAEIQSQLFRAGADLATTFEKERANLVRIRPGEVQWLEGSIDALSTELPELTHFILPGGTLAAAHLQVARAVCRRSERLAIHLSQQEKVNRDLLIYLNRLSDFLFTLARFENHLQGVTEKAWQPNDKSPN